MQVPVISQWYITILLLVQYVSLLVLYIIANYYAVVYDFVFFVFQPVSVSYQTDKYSVQVSKQIII